MEVSALLVSLMLKPSLVRRLRTVITAAATTAKATPQLMSPIEPDLDRVNFCACTPCSGALAE